MVTLDSPPNEAKYRCHWTAPMAIDPFDHNTVLYGCQLILKTTNGGQSWTEFSPDLSTKDPSRIVSNGGIVGDNLGQYDGEVVWDIEYSKIQRGPDLGRHQRRQAVEHERRRRELDTTSRRTSRTCRPGARSRRSGRRRSMPAPSIRRVAVPPDGRPQALHLQDRRTSARPGRRSPATSRRAIRSTTCCRLSGNPNKKGMLFAGTGRAFYYSLDDGGTWTQIQGRPAAGAGQLDHR